MATERSIQELNQLLAEFIKIIKVVSVYPADNPLPIKLKESFSDRFADMIRDLGALTFRIKQDLVLYDNDVVYKDRNNEDKLAGLFYKAGINELVFTREFDFNECNRFFNVLKSYINKEAGAGDLVALFWEEDIPGFGYTTLEDVMLYEYDNSLVQSIQDRGETYARDPESDDNTGGQFKYEDLFNENAIELEDDTGEITLSRSEKMAEEKMGLKPTPPKGPKLDDIDTARIVREAFSLEKDDMARIEGIIREDTKFDMYDNASYLMTEILWQQNEYTEFTETVTVVEKLQTEFIRYGKLGHAAELLLTLRDISVQLKEERPKWVERINEAIAVAGGRERLSHLAEALNDNITIAPTELGKYLSVFGWESLLVITDLLGDLEHQHHREAVCDFLVIHGKNHVDFIGKAIYDKRWYVVRNAASILARIGGQRAHAFLDKILNHEESRVRLEMVKRLSKLDSAESLHYLYKLVWDPNETVSREAIEGILAHVSNERYDIVTSIIDDDRFVTLREAYQEALIVAFSRLGGEGAVEYLEKLTSGWGLFQTQAQDFYQRTAYRALGYNRSEKALKVLEKAAKSWKKKTKSLAEDALTIWYQQDRSES